MSFDPSTYDFDRFLRYDDMVIWLQHAAERRPDLITLETYGHSYEGRKLWVAAITDSSTGSHESKPAHWVDANIHAVEVTGGVAALHLIHHLMTGAETNDPMVVQALRTRTFYVAPRVNPDGVEAALADRPMFHRSSVRSWPWTDGHRWPGLHAEDVDGDGRILTMRIADPDGSWVEHPDDPRVMVPVPLDGMTDRPRYRLLAEGRVVDYDGYTVPTPRDPSGLDLNRNFPAGWSTTVTGSGDHPMSEPEIDALVRAVRARTNVCGYNAYHTFGGVLLRPSSTKPDSSLSPADVWTWNEFGKRGTELTGYKVHSVYEDFTWDKSDVMSGAGDDWAYEHLGVYSWTTEFWDVIHHATGERAHTFIWYEGPTPEQELAVARWTDRHAPGSYVPWRAFDHPDLGPIEIGGCDVFHTWTNPPLSWLKKEVVPHAEFAVHQALASPRLEIGELKAESLGANTWRVVLGVANTGWLPTDISGLARKSNLVLPMTAEIRVPNGEVIGTPARVKLGQLEGRAAFRLNGGAMSDGTPDRVRHEWIVSAASGTEIEVEARHVRAGRTSVRMVLEG